MLCMVCSLSIRTELESGGGVLTSRCLLQNDLATTGVSVSTAAGLYNKVKQAAQQLGIREFLPEDYRVLNESLP